MQYTVQDLGNHVWRAHGGLARNRAVFDQIEGLLTANPVVHLAGSIAIAVGVHEILDPGEALRVSATLDGDEVPVEAVVANETGTLLGPPVRLLRRNGVLGATPPLPGPGVCFWSAIRELHPIGSCQFHTEK